MSTTAGKQPRERVRAVQDRRRSGAAGSHDSRPRKQRTRRNVKRAALREWE